MTFIKIQTGGYIVAEQMESFGVDSKESECGNKARVCAYTADESSYTIKAFNSSDGSSKEAAQKYLDNLIEALVVRNINTMVLGGD